MVLLNDLLEQAANLAAQLADEAQDASGAAEAIAERIQGLTDRLSTEGDEAHRHLQALAEKLAQAEAGLETAGGGATNRLDDLATRAAAVQADVEGLLASAKLRMDELEALKATLASTLEQEIEQGGAELEQLSTQVEALQDTIEQRLEAASDLVVAFQGSVAAARTEFAEGKGRLFQALEQLESAARDQTQAFVEGVDASLGESAKALVEMANRMINAHNAATTDLSQRFAEESREWASAALVPLQEAIEELTRLTTDHGTTLEAAAEAVAPKVQAAMDLLQRSQAVLEQARLLE